MTAMLVLAEEAVEESAGFPAWAFGVTALAVLLLALFVVTRFNPDR